MKVASLVSLAFLFVSISLSSSAQTFGVLALDVVRSGVPTNAYNDCAAILINGKMLVDEYSPRGKCKLEKNEGTLTVATVQLSESAGIPVKNIGFRVAIKNARTNTLWMYSDKVLKEVEIRDIMAKCEKDDRILILTVDQTIALPHPEIEFIGGC